MRKHDAMGTASKSADKDTFVAFLSLSVAFAIITELSDSLLVYFSISELGNISSLILVCDLGLGLLCSVFVCQCIFSEKYGKPQR